MNIIDLLALTAIGFADTATYTALVVDTFKVESDPAIFRASRGGHIYHDQW